jgi:PI31 proteasome regulator N-terminal/PI31 proteasome regulator
MEFLVKVTRLGSKALIFGIGLGDDRTAQFEIPIQDYLSPSTFPLEKSTESTEPLERELQDAFISSSRLSDLSGLFKLSILQKLMPGIHKEGYEESPTEQTQSSSSSQDQRQPPQQRQDPLRGDIYPQPARPHPFDDPLAAQPRRPMPAGDFPPPGFEDEYEINRPGGRGYPPGFGGRNPLSIGDDDLNPPGIGPHDPLRIGGGGHRGMHPTFDDPMFGGGGGLGGAFDSRHPPGAR